MGYAGPKAISKVNMIIKDKSCKLPGITGLGNPLKKALIGNQDTLPMELQAAIKATPGKKKSSGLYKKGCYATKAGKKKHTGLLQKKGCYSNKK